jgi:hypothetical protein
MSLSVVIKRAELVDENHGAVIVLELEHGTEGGAVALRKLIEHKTRLVSARAYIENGSPRIIVTLERLRESEFPAEADAEEEPPDDELDPVDPPDYLGA